MVNEGAILKTGYDFSMKFPMSGSRLEHACSGDKIPVLVALTADKEEPAKRCLLK